MFFFCLSHDLVIKLLKAVNCYIDVLSCTREPSIKPELSDLIDVYNKLADSVNVSRINFTEKVGF